MYQMGPGPEHHRAAPFIDECNPGGCSMKVEGHFST